MSGPPVAVLCLFSALAAGGNGVARAAVTPAGAEFQINQYTTSFQRSSSVAAAGDGSFVVAWVSYQDGFGGGIFGRRFDATGGAQGVEFQVNLVTTSNQRAPAVARNADGDFVVVWHSGHHQDGDSYGIFGRRFASSGAPQGADFQVNSYTPGTQRYPSIAMADDGAFVVVWNDDSEHDGGGDGVFGRRFDAMANPQATEFQVSARTLGNQTNTRVSGIGSGAFVVVWAQYDYDGNAIVARRFDASAAPASGDLQVSTYTEGQEEPFIAMTGSGGFVAVWQDIQGGLLADVRARRFGASGLPVGSELVVNTYSGPGQNPSVAIEKGDEFVVAWSGASVGESFGVFARRFDAGGTARGAQFQVNTYETGEQYANVVAPNRNGGFIVAWASESAQDGDGDGVFAQLYLAQLTLDVDGDGQVDALTDGLLVLRYTFGFRGAVLIAGAVDLANCTRCTAPQIEAYLGSL